MATIASRLLQGPTLLHVGERDPKDKKFAPDEFVYADPGVGGSVVVAPRPKGMKPTAANAMRALRAQAKKDATPAMKKAQGGISLPGNAEMFQGSDFLTSLMAMLSGGAGTFAVDLPGMQSGIMALLGMINPALLGETDPEQFRAGLGGGPRFYQERGSRGVMFQLPSGEFRPVGQMATARALGYTGREDLNIVNPGTFRDVTGAKIGLTEVPGLLQSFERPTLPQQQLSYQRALRGLSPVGGARRTPSVSAGF